MSLSTYQPKLKLLLLYTVDDIFFSNSSPRFLSHTEELKEKILNHLEYNSNKYYGVINVVFPMSTTKDVNPLQHVKESRIINLTLNSKDTFDIANEIEIKSENGFLLFNGNDFNFLFPSEDYEIHIAGVNVNGCFKDVIENLLDDGYSTYLYSNMIKRFKKTEQDIRNIRNKNFNYCSSDSALA